MQTFKDACAETTIAIRVDKVQGERGFYTDTKEFMQGLLKFCVEEDMLHLSVEVHTG